MLKNLNIKSLLIAFILGLIVSYLSNNIAFGVVVAVAGYMAGVAENKRLKSRNKKNKS